MSKFLFAAFTCAALVFGGCASGGLDEPESSAESGGTLSLTSAAPDRVTGTYTRNGVTISFDARRTAEGSTLLLKGKGDRVLVSTAGVGETRVVSFMEGRVTFKPPTALSAPPPSGQQDFGAPTDLVTMDGDEKAFGELMFTDEAQVLPWLSRALGERGLTGKTHPASLDIHTLGAMVARVREIEVPSMEPELADGTDDVRTAQSSCGRPSQNDCFGMCGRGCGCWKWVCGDCCFHDGCAAHDNDCRKCAWNHPAACARCASFASFWSGGGC
ncbi:MAG: hypothetical protein ACXVEF_22190 [Polyangiales bacterium]